MVQVYPSTVQIPVFFLTTKARSLLSSRCPTSAPCGRERCTISETIDEKPGTRRIRRASLFLLFSSGVASTQRFSLGLASLVFIELYTRLLCESNAQRASASVSFALGRVRVWPRFCTLPASCQSHVFGWEEYHYVELGSDFFHCGTHSRRPRIDRCRRCGNRDCVGALRCLSHSLCGQFCLRSPHTTSCLGGGKRVSLVVRGSGLPFTMQAGRLHHKRRTINCIAARLLSVFSCSFLSKLIH
jgi:hypothetical protein